MKEYISDPSRIVFACWEHKDITRMGDGVFRMAFTGQSFLSISIDMSVDIQLCPAEDGTIKCKSVGYSVEDMAKLLGQVGYGLNMPDFVCSVVCLVELTRLFCAELCCVCHGSVFFPLVLAVFVICYRRDVLLCWGVNRLACGVRL